MVPHFFSWFEAMRLSFAALGQCPHVRVDPAANCRPSFARNLLTEKETEDLLGSMRTFEEEFATVEMLDSTMKGVVDRAAETLIEVIRDRCDRSEDYRVVRGVFAERSATPPGRNFGRLSAAIALNRPQVSGVLRRDSNYVCAADCRGETCDEWVYSHGFGADLLELEWGCDCAMCRSGARSIRDSGGDFSGGGIQFPGFSNVTFSPALGDAVLYGSRVFSSNVETDKGSRFVLELEFDRTICRLADEHFDLFLTSLAVAALIPVAIYIVFFVDFEGDDSEKKSAGA